MVKWLSSTTAPPPWLTRTTLAIIPPCFSVPFAPEEYWQKVNSSAPPIRYIEALKPCSLLGQKPSSVHSPFESWSSRKPTCRISRGYAPRHPKRSLFCPIDIRRFHNMLRLRIDIRGCGYLSPGPVRLPILGIKNSCFALYTRCRRSAYSVARKKKSGRAMGVMYQMRPDGVARPLFYKEGPIPKWCSQGQPC
jgi:hypothetical protein